MLSHDDATSGLGTPKASGAITIGAILALIAIRILMERK